jgi:adenine-specific DNA-methyltransferase
MGRAGTKLARLGAAIDAEQDAMRSAGTNLIAELRAQSRARADDPEALYREVVPIARRKRLGQYFTPQPIAELMVRWIAEIRPRTTLDPAVGPGIFPRILRGVCPRTSITAVDVDPVALAAARSVIGAGVRFIEADFLTWTNEREFDAIVANPPYLRHHDMSYALDIHAEVGRRNGIALSRLTNLYALFILEICRRLRAGGRAAIIVPGEWMNANFGAPLKDWLLARGLLDTIIYWSHAATVFTDALTTVSVLLIDKGAAARPERAVRTIFVRENATIHAIEAALHGEETDDEALLVQQLPPATLRRFTKWNHALANGSLPLPPGFTPLARLATTRRGIATGANRYFHLRPSDVVRLGIREESTRFCVGRAADVARAIYAVDDYARLAAADERCLLLDIRDEPAEKELAYLRAGERDGIDRRYLCASRRSDWYRMEQRPPAPVWAGVFARRGLRFVWNAAGVANLTAFHCIYPHDEDPAFAAALTACLNSSVVQTHARQHVRVYGAGLANMEPRDLLQIPVPDLRRVSLRLRQALCHALAEIDRDARGHATAAHAGLDALVGEAAAAAAREWTR